MLIGGAVSSPFSLFAQKKKQKGQSTILTQKDSLRLDAAYIDATQEFLNEDYREAIKAYEKIKDDYPSNSAVYHQIAKCYGELKVLDKAVRYEEIAVELSPSNKFYYLYLADLYRELKAWQEMAICYDAMLKNTADAEEYYYDLGHLYAFFFKQEKRKYIYAKSEVDDNYLTQKIPKKERKKMDDLIVKALEAYDSYEEKFGISPQFIEDKQDLLVEARQIDEAVREGDRLVKKHPDNIEYVLDNAKIYSSQKEYQKAINYLVEKQEIKSDYHISLALIFNYEKLGEGQKVNETIETLINSKEAPLEEKTTILVQLNQVSSDKESSDYILKLSQEMGESYPEEVQVQLLLGDVYFFRGDFEQARNQYLVALDLSKEQKEVWRKVLGIDLKNNDFLALKEDAEQATVVFKEEGLFYYWLGVAYQQEKDYKNGIKNFVIAREWTSKTDVLVKIQSSLGESYNYLKDYTKSDKAFDQALIYSPNNALVLNNYSYYLSLRKEHLNKAKSMSKRLIMLYPNEPAYLDTYGWVLYQSKQYKEASLYLEKAASQTQSIAILEHYGDVLYRLKKVDEAIVWWQKSKEAGNTSSLIDKKIADKKLYEE